MPGTAASNLQSRAHAKARPSANARAASLVANTPVLFRLPLIPNVPTQELPATFADATAGLPTAQLSAVTTGAVAGAGVAIGSQASASASTANSQTEATAHAVPTRTWWEHWSSGIVLIVLLIALATASILAWQGSGKPNEKLLADTEQSSEKPFESLSDLSAIEVPKLGEPKLGTAKADADVLTLPALKSNPATSSQASLQSNSMQPETADEVSNGGDADDASSLIPSGPMGLSFDAPSESTKSASKPEATLTPEAHATASLQSPVVKPQEPLFKDEPTATRATVSAQPASTPSNMNSTSSTLNSGSPKSTATGSSPAMWDSSSLNPTDKTSTSGQGLSLELSSPTKPASDSNTLGTASKPEPTTTTPALLTSQPASTPATTTSTAAKPATSATGPAVPSNISYAGKTNTPELDRAALIATFRQYSSTDMTAPPVDATANRYRAPTPATSTPGLQSPSSPAGTAASMVGFTQQPTQQQLNQQQFTPQPTQQPNYTLQPTQQIQPQQNQTLQYPTQQFQNQYAPQGQQPLYQQQQFQPQQSQPTSTQQSFNQPMQFGTQPTTAQQFTAPNTNLNNLGLINNGTTANTGNGYYVPPTAPTNSQPNTLSYPSLK